MVNKLYDIANQTWNWAIGYLAGAIVGYWDYLPLYTW